MYMLYLHISPMFPHKSSGRHIFSVETTHSFTWAYPQVKYKTQNPKESNGLWIVSHFYAVHESWREFSPP